MPQREEYEFTRVDDIAYVSIDPGTFFSGLCTFDKRGEIIHSQKLLNKLVLVFLKKVLDKNQKKNILLYMEKITPYGIIGSSTINTIFYCGHVSGRFYRHKNLTIKYVSRKDVKKELLGKGKWKDADVRRKLIEIFGKEKIKTDKIFPSKEGSMFVATDCWSALAVFIACTRNDSISSKEW